MKELNQKITELKNISIGGDGLKRVGYKSLRGYIQLIKRLNKRYKKEGWSGEFSIKLPIKD